MKTFFLRLLAIGAGLWICTSLQAEPTLAGHSGLKGQALDAETVKAVLLGKRVTLGDVRVVVVIAKSNPAQDAFLQAHLAMTTSQFQNHWRRLFMTGGGSAPKIVETEKDACKVAADTPGAIVITGDEPPAGLAVLATN